MNKHHSRRRNISYQFSRSLVTAILASVVLCAPVSSFAQSSGSDPDWPCIQALVPSIEPAVLWPEPLSEEHLSQWKEDDPLYRLAQKLGGSNRISNDEIALIEGFVNETPEKDRFNRLNKLAVGTLFFGNQRRSTFIKGIKKYTRQQSAIATQIEEGLNTLALLDSHNNDQDDNQGAMPIEMTPEEQAELQERLKWHQRVFDQREQSMSALCDQPVLVEQHLSDLLREMAQHLP